MHSLLYHQILTDEEKREICTWKYPDEYSIYNSTPYDELKQKNSSFMNEANQQNFYAFYDSDIFVGYINLIERANKFSLGIAVKPELCSKGYGQKIIKIALEISNIQNSNKPVGLQVRSWNKRAINCYRKAGFEIEGEEYSLTTPLGEGNFYRMIYKKNSFENKISQETNSEK